MAFLYGRAGRLTAKIAGFRPGQKGSPALPNKGFYNQDKPFPCAACCKPGGQ